MITIYGELYSSKNSKEIVKFGDKPALIPSKAFRANIKPIEQQLTLLRCKWLNETKNLCTPLRIVFRIYRKTKRRFDYVNIVQGLLDSMVKCGWIPDDNADVVLPVFYPYDVDKNNPRVDIWADNLLTES